MQWHINELSLDGQFVTSQAFCAVLSELLKLRANRPLLRERLFCSRQLGECLVTTQHSFQQAVRQNANPQFKRQVLEWIGKSGPFWNDTRTPNPNDYFTFQDIEVTEQGLGEAARRTLTGIEAGVFSFTGSRFNFAGTPLAVQHGWREPELDFGIVEIQNFWNLGDLAQANENAPPEPYNWHEAMAYARSRFSGLILAETLEKTLQPGQPFSRALYQRTFELLGILQRLVDETDMQGHLSETGLELRNQYFAGGGGETKQFLFTGSSTEEKNLPKYKKLLKFPDPVNKTHILFCPWHGKIKTHEFRIHFEWPRPPGQREIKVVYIGPKLTKK